MVRSDSADEDQIINEDGFDLMEEDEEMISGTGALPAIIPEWNAVKNAQFNLTNLSNSSQRQHHHQNAENDALTAAAIAAAANVASLRSVVIPSSGPLLATTNRSSIGQPAAPLSPITSSDPDRRLRRQIANCNERRRMQSINAGFMALRALLPKKEGEKLSKAAILQQTAEMVHRMLKDKNFNPNIDSSSFFSEECEAKKPKLDDDSQKIMQLEASLEHERTKRMMLEQQVVKLREIIEKNAAAPTTTTTTATAGTNGTIFVEGKCGGNGTTPVIPRTPMTTPTVNCSTVFSFGNHGYVAPSMSNTLNDAPERKPSLCNDSTTSPMSMLNLNGSPSSSDSLAASRLATPTPLLKVNHPNSAFESTVIRPTPLAPISVETTSPCLSTPSPLTVNHHPLAPMIFSTSQTQNHQQPQQQANILFSNVMSHNQSTNNPLLNLSVQQHSHPSAFMRTQASSMAAHHSLQTILDAIHLLEGNAIHPPSPPPTSQTSLVR